MSANGNISMSVRFDFEPLRLFLDRVEAQMGDAVAEAVRAAAKAGQDVGQANAPVLTGRLRASITPGQLSTTAAGVLQMGVGPRGSPVFLYAQKEEKRTPYMAKAGAAAQRSLDVGMTAAVARVWR